MANDWVWCRPETVEGAVFCEIWSEKCGAKIDKSRIAPKLGVVEGCGWWRGMRWPKLNRDFFNIRMIGPAVSELWEFEKKLIRVP